MIRSLYRFLHPRFQTLFLDYPVQLKPRYTKTHPHPELYSLIDSQRASYEKFLQEILARKEALWAIQKSGIEKDPTQLAWNNGFLPGLDIMALYTMLSVYRPGRYLEIGSGHSTRVAYKAKMDNGLNCRIISIDPQPRAEIDQLADEVIRQPFETSGYDVVDILQEGDILFIDNSHRILPNSDAMTFFMEILPRLKKGVIVHIHDIYLPYDYPPFMCERFYSEQYGLAFYLLANPQRYQPILPNFFISEDESLSATLASVWQHPNLHGVEQHGGSFWLRIA